MIDIHAHILPDLDDGAKDMDMALRMAEIAVKSGTEIIIATPHFLAEAFDNDKAQVIEACADFNAELAKHDLPLQVLPGGEYHLEPDLAERLARNELLTLNYSRYLLLELPGAYIPKYTEDLIYDLQIQGIIPIIAHPERNMELIRTPHKLKHLAERGVLAQVTADSVTGHFGSRVKMTAFNFITSGIISFLASDAHSDRGRTPALAEAAQIIAEKYSPDYAAAIVRNNPQDLLENQEINLLPPVSTSWIRKIFQKVRND